MGVNFPQAKYSGTKQDDAPPVPDGGKSQPILRTESNYDNPNLHWGTQPTGNREGSEEPPVPTSATAPGESTDIIDPDAKSNLTIGSDNRNIFKGGQGNG